MAPIANRRQQTMVTIRRQRGYERRLARRAYGIVDTMVKQGFLPRRG